MRFRTFRIPAMLLLIVALSPSPAASAKTCKDWDDGPSCTGCTFLYASTNAHRILIYRIDPNGGLGSPLSTLSAPNASYLGHLDHLYAIDANRRAVDQYRVNGVDGALTPCSPISFRAASGSPAGLAFGFPGDSIYMYVGNTNGTISVFNIGNPAGSVAKAIAGSPFAVGAAPVNLLPTWWSPTLYAADLRKNVIFAFTVGVGGGLTAVSGSPFAAPPKSAPAGMAVGADRTRGMLYVALSGSSQIAAFSIAASGALSPVPGSPFEAGRHPQSLLDFGAGNREYLYALNSLDHTISAYSVDRTSGALRAVQGSPFAAGTASAGMVIGMTFPVPHRIIYVPDLQSKSILAFAVDESTGSLSQLPGSPFPTSAGPEALTTVSRAPMSPLPQYVPAVDNFQKDKPLLLPEPPLPRWPPTL